jgi:hypothetical protein
MYSSSDSKQHQNRSSEWQNAGAFKKFRKHLILGGKNVREGLMPSHPTKKAPVNGGFFLLAPCAELLISNLWIGSRSVSRRRDERCFWLGRWRRCRHRISWFNNRRWQRRVVLRDQWAIRRGIPVIAEVKEPTHNQNKGCDDNRDGCARALARLFHLNIWFFLIIIHGQ